MHGDIRSVNEATFEWEGRDWSGAGVRTSILAVHRSSMASICWKSENLERTRIHLMTDRTTTVRTRILRLVVPRLMTCVGVARKTRECPRAALP